MCGNNKVFRLLQAQRAKVYSVDKDEEAFFINSDGKIIATILPGEHKHIHLLRDGVSILYINRKADIIGLCGGGLYSYEKSTYFGTWGRFFCRFASPARFAALHAAELASGDSADEILSKVFRPLIKETLCLSVDAKLSNSELQMKLESELTNEALRQGMHLEYYKTEFMGYT